MKVLKYGKPFHYEVTCKRCNSLLRVEPEEVGVCEITCPVCGNNISPFDSDKVYDELPIKPNVSQECLHDTK